MRMQKINVPFPQNSRRGNVGKAWTLLAIRGAGAGAAAAAAAAAAKVGQVALRVGILAM